MNPLNRSRLCRRSLLSSLPLLAAFGLATVATNASAADIVTVAGSPGTPDWFASCTPHSDPPTVPAGASQLSACPPGAPAGTCLHRVTIPQEFFPNATCNDGTPGTFYIRPGVGEDVDRWVIHLQGGGMCTDHETCLERWCGQQGGLPYRANKMSSDWDHDGVSNLPDEAVAGGMALVHPDNEFSTWTHVWAYYCSSDTWLGRESDVAFVDGADQFDLDVRGHTILTAMRRMLRQQGPSAGWTATGGVTVPDLDTATDIIFTGTSAGGKGAVANADWFLTPFDEAKTALVIDAAIEPSDWALAANDVWIDADNNGYAEEPFLSYRIGLLTDMWAPGGYFDEIDAFADVSCRDNYEPMGRMDRCSITSNMLILSHGAVPFVETPTFVRKDLSDNSSRKYWIQHPNVAGFSLMIGSGYGTPTTSDDHIRLNRDTLVGLYDDHDSVTGAFGPRCGKHVGLENTAAFGAMSTPDTDDTTSPPSLLPGTDMTMHDALWDWYDVGSSTFAPIRRLDTDEPGVSFSGC